LPFCFYFSFSEETFSTQGPCTEKERRLALLPALEPCALWFVGNLSPSPEEEGGRRRRRINIHILPFLTVLLSLGRWFKRVCSSEQSLKSFLEVPPPSSLLEGRKEGKAKRLASSSGRLPT